MDPYFAEPDRPPRDENRKVTAFFALLIALFQGYWFLHFTDRAAAFADGALVARGTIVAISSRGCRVYDYCLDNQKSVYTATVAFTDGQGRPVQAKTDFRYRGRKVGDPVQVNYLPDDPTVIVADDLEFQQGLWVIFRILLGGGALIAVGLAVAYCLPKDALFDE